MCGQRPLSEKKNLGNYLAAMRLKYQSLSKQAVFVIRLNFCLGALFYVDVSINYEKVCVPLFFF